MPGLETSHLQITPVAPHPLEVARCFPARLLGQTRPFRTNLIGVDKLRHCIRRYLRDNDVGGSSVGVYPLLRPGLTRKLDRLLRKLGLPMLLIVVIDLALHDDTPYVRWQFRRAYH